MSSQIPSHRVRQRNAIVRATASALLVMTLAVHDGGGGCAGGHPVSRRGYKWGTSHVVGLVEIHLQTLTYASPSAQAHPELAQRCSPDRFRRVSR